jgi:hypothetical protein
MIRRQETEDGRQKRWRQETDEFRSQEARNFSWLPGF